MRQEEKIHDTNLKCLKENKDYLDDEKLKKLSETIRMTEKGLKSMQAAQSMFQPAPPRPHKQHRSLEECAICTQV